MPHIVRAFVVLLAVLLLAACSLSPEVQPTLTHSPQPTPMRSPLPTTSPLPTPARSPLPTPTSDKGPSAGAPVPSGADAATRAAINDLAAKRQVAPEAVQVVSVSQVDWPDTSLGCPQPGMFYAQIIVEGYKIILSAGGQPVEYHADQRGRVVTCSK